MRAGLGRGVAAVVVVAVRVVAAVRLDGAAGGTLRGAATAAAATRIHALDFSSVTSASSWALAGCR